MVVTVIDSKLSLIPTASQLETIFQSGTPRILSVASEGFSLNETQEILAFEVQISGVQKKVFWLYDHENKAFDQTSLNSQLG